MARYGDLARRDLRGMLASRVGDHIEGTTTLGGNLSTMFDNARLEGSLGLGFKPGNYVYFPTGVLAGTERLITSYIWGSLMTFAPNAGTAVPSGLIYELHNYPVKTYNDALKRAEARLRDYTWIDDLVEFTWTTDALSVSLGPTTLDSVSDVQMYDSGWVSMSGPYRNPRQPVWRVVPGTSPRLQFYDNAFIQPASGATFRIYGQRRPLLMSLDSDTCEILEQWVLDIAEMEIHLSRDVGSKDAAQRSARAQSAWTRFKLSMGGMVGPKPNSVVFR